MVLKNRKAARWKDRGRSGLSSKKAFQKETILGGIYNSPDGYFPMNLDARCHASPAIVETPSGKGSQNSL